MDNSVYKLFGDVAFGMQYNYDQFKEDEIIRGMLSYLTENQKYIIVKYYFDRMTADEIGKSFGIKGARVIQIKDKIIMELGSMATVRNNVVIYNVFAGKKLPDQCIPFYFLGLPVHVCNVLKRNGMNNMYDVREYMEKRDKTLSLVRGLGEKGAAMVISKMLELS